MATVVQAYRFALDPTPTQEQALLQHCGAARKAYNTMLDLVMKNWSQRAAEKTYGIADEELTPAMGWSAYSLRKGWNGLKDVAAPWWAQNSKEAYSSGCTNLAASLANWKASHKGTRKGESIGTPVFKSRNRTVPTCTFTTGAIRVDEDRHHVTLPVLGTIRTHESTRKLTRRIEGGTARITTATISLRRGRWFVSFVAHVLRVLERPAHVMTCVDIVGIDVGVRDLVVVATPDGMELERVEAPRELRKAENRLKTLQRKAARRRGPWDPAMRARREPSQGWRKTQAMIKHAHARVANLRIDHLHKTTTRLTQSHQLIGVEALAVKGMMRRARPKPDRAKTGKYLPNKAKAKSGTNKSIADASLGTLLRMLEYKSTWYGSLVVKADRFFPSSKMCSGCGSVKSKLTLSERTYHCTNCGLSIDRDLNAAINLARLAQADGRGTGGSGSLDIGGVRGRRPTPAALGNEAETLMGTVVSQDTAT
jgi:putative transposase